VEALGYSAPHLADHILGPPPAIAGSNHLRVIRALFSGRRRIARALQQKTRDEEPGCLAYVFSADPCVAGRLVVYELWHDEASLAAQVYDTTFTPRADFFTATT
jgi:Antibiotic biosynthesis monooxygenase